ALTRERYCARISCQHESTVLREAPLRSSSRWRARLSGRLGLTEAAERPDKEEGRKPERSNESPDDFRRGAGDEAPRGLDHARERVDERDAVDPALEQREGHVHRCEEEDEEDRTL